MEFLKDILAKIDNKFFSKMKKKQKIYLLVFIVIVGVLMWAFITAGVITHNFNRALLKGGDNKQAVEVSSMIINESNNGKKMFEIYGETGSYSSDHKVAHLNNVIGNFFKNNIVNMSFQSSRASYDEKTKNLQLYENTYIVLDSGISITSDRMIYYGNTKIIEATGHVKVFKRNKFVSTANKAVLDSNYSAFKLIGHAQTKIYGSGTKNELEGK